MESVREFESEGCDVVTCPILPHEIIEMILFRLPVKDLLRFRVVCKQWEATISNATFVETHLQQQYKNPSSRYLIAWEDLNGRYNGLHVAELRNNRIEFVSAIELGLGRGITTLCCCDGLYLMYFPWDEEVVHVKCVLWNPSTRMYRELYCPVQVDVNRIPTTARGMYYDPLKKDYKIVIADIEHFAVYSCRDNKWGDVKEMKGFSGECCPNNYYGVFVNGCIYWLIKDRLDPEPLESDDHSTFREVICFDCKDESFKRLPLPNCKDGDKKVLQLTSFGGQLCLLITDDKSGGPIEIMKKVDGNDEWMESKGECLSEYRPESHPIEVYQLSQNEILLCVLRSAETGTRRERVYMVYDKSKNTLVRIHNNINPPSATIAPITKHLENLILL